VRAEGMHGRHNDGAGPCTHTPEQPSARLPRALSSPLSALAALSNWRGRRENADPLLRNSQKASASVMGPAAQRRADGEPGVECSLPLTLAQSSSCSAAGARQEADERTDWLTNRDG
jgi:hypothetical protein